VQGSVSAGAAIVRPMPWTPLHASLGETSGDLDFALLERACTERVAERADLDWKRQLPLTAEKGDAKAKQYQQLELAKDIAAMANSGGGMIVYGVAEISASGTSAADTIVPVGLVDETTTRDIRRVAGNLVYPPVTAIDLLPLAPESDPGGGVLVMLVPDSLDRPHLVHPSNGTDWFCAPYRHGPDTVWMVERQLASAYTERESGRRRRAQEFDARFDEFTASLPADPDLRWVVALAVPEQPATRPRDLHLMKANGIIERAWTSPLPSGLGPRDLTRDETTRRGLQRFTRTGSRAISAAAPARARARVEVHGDGTVAIAFTRDGALFGEGRQPTQVPVNDIESTAVDFLALLMQSRKTLGVTGDFVARLTVHPPTEIFRRPDSVVSGSFVPWDEQRVLGYRPVDGVVIGTAGREELLSSWVDLVTDAVHQAGAPCTLDANRIATEIWLDE
jgi:hypothetical protein